MTNSSGSRREHVSDLIGRCLRGVALLFFLAWPTHPVAAQDTADIGILVVDMQRIQRDAAAAISVRAQSAAKRASLETTIAERAKEISLEEAQLAELRADLEKEIAERARELNRGNQGLASLLERLRETEFGDRESEFRQRVRGFEEKVFANRDFAQRESGKLQSSLAEASRRLRGEIAPILASLLRERKAQLMLDTSQVVLSAETLDVTEEVIARLDEAMPTMNLEPTTSAE